MRLARPRSIVFAFIALSSAVLLGACGNHSSSKDAAPPDLSQPGDSSVPDLARPDLATPDLVMHDAATDMAEQGSDLSVDMPDLSGCADDDGCGDGQHCDPTSHQCVDCITDDHCAPGSLCQPDTHTCAAGCSEDHPCGDSGVCQLDGGTCVECLGDENCVDPTRPRCDTAQSRCVPCLPENDNCALGSYCAQSGGEWSCTTGCKVDDECHPAAGQDAGAPDAGTESSDADFDGGSDADFDGGSDADFDGGSDADLGAGGEDAGMTPLVGPGRCDPDTHACVGCLDDDDCTTTGRCDPTSHACVGCVGDDDCSPGRLCQNQVCVPGCSETHGCAVGQDCCDGSCFDLSSDDTHCGTCDHACDSGDACCAGGCVDLENDLNNCGGCGALCAPANASSSCQTGVCAITSCDTGFEDCDHDVANGCEANLEGDTANCGACGHACPNANGTASCTMGSCSIECDQGWLVCGGAPDCNTHIDADPDNCGDCGQACSTNHIAASCGAGLCNGACDTGFVDCDGDKRSNGCEIDIDNDVNHCGACGTVCAVEHGAPSCAAGACGVGSCESGWGDCDGDYANGCEDPVASDVNNCGACGTVCSVAHGAPSCTDGHCGVASCTGDWQDCDGDYTNGCEANIRSDAAHCGACGTPCAPPHATGQCVGGACSIGQCDEGWGDCDGQLDNGCETDLRSDVNRCGNCATICNTPHGTPTCTDGQCAVASCTTGYDNCDGIAANGCETNLSSSSSNCGSCGNACEAAHGSVACMTGSCKVVACSDGWGNCDSDDTNGCETNVNGSDPNHCGSCSSVCVLDHATAGCNAGSCTVASCDAGWADCDGLPGNGCETNLDTDAAHCGSCANNCGRATCQGGTCFNPDCTPGYRDCNNNPDDGCETHVDADTLNCGSCGHACSQQNATETCSAGTCQVISCGSGFGNCDANPENGCETNLNVSAAHCGSCGHACSQQNATETCSAGACQLVSCAAGFDNCDGNLDNGCETALNTSTNCGACGQACSRANAESSCATGTCQLGACATGFGNCDGDDANGCEAVLTTTLNCGACGQTCSRANASVSCDTGSCELIACTTGFGNCDGNDANGCETSLDSTDNCGGCGQVCALANASATCQGGACIPETCSTGYADCDGQPANGCEVVLESDGQNCGVCGKVCGMGESCISGTCTVVCPGNQMLCGGACTDLDADPANCGGCGGACSTNHIAPSCAGGTCSGTCDAGFDDCNDDLRTDGCETDTHNDAQNCGGCGIACDPPHAIPSCSAGACAVAGCEPGWDDCNGDPSDGCETEIGTDQDNCGACGSVCAPQNANGVCLSGTCSMDSCFPGFGDCDGDPANGCETDLDSATSCGACGNDCTTLHGTGATCESGACAFAGCEAGWTDCDGDPTNGCEANTDSDGNNCGACGQACLVGELCQSGACCGVKINELAIATTDNSSAKWFELYNSCGTDIDLSKWSVQYRSAAGTSDTTVVTNINRSIAANGYLTYAHTSVTTFTPDSTFSQSILAAGGGGLALKDKDGNVIDSVGYGTATNIYVEGTAAAAPAKDKSLARTPNGKDTNNNSADLAVTATPTPGAGN